MENETEKIKLSAGGKLSDLHVAINTYSSLKTGEELFKEKASPLVYYNKMRYQRKKYQDCSQDNLRKLIRKGDITDLHGKVLEMLYEFTYLNAFMIRTRLSYLNGRKYELSVEKCRKLLKNMVKKGLILQYEFFHTDSEGKEHGSAFVYALSEGGRKFLARTGVLQKREDTLFSIETVLKMLAFNQFHILLQKQYSKDILLQSNIYGNTWNATGVPGTYQLRFPDDNTFFLHVFSVRLNTGWHESYLYTLQELQSYIYTKGIRNSCILVICETEHHAMECHRFAECISNVKAPIFYTTDLAIVSYEDVFERLIEGIPGGNHGERNIISLQLK